MKINIVEIMMHDSFNAMDKHSLANYYGTTRRYYHRNCNIIVALPRHDTTAGEFKFEIRDQLRPVTFTSSSESEIGAYDIAVAFINSYRNKKSEFELRETHDKGTKTLLFNAGIVSPPGIPPPESLNFPAESLKGSDMIDSNMVANLPDANATASSCRTASSNIPKTANKKFEKKKAKKYYRLAVAEFATFINDPLLAMYRVDPETAKKITTEDYKEAKEFFKWVIDQLPD